MKHRKSVTNHVVAAGFTLPAILVVVGALLILAVGILIVSGIERSTARSFVDRQRAELAARTALEDIRAVFITEGAKDDYLVIQSLLKENVKTLEAGETAREKAPFLFLTRRKTEGPEPKFIHVPLFSSNGVRNKADSTVLLTPPVVEDFVSTTENQRKDFEALPYQDHVRVDWLPVKDAKGRIVSRYAYWVEDLQAKVDPLIAGNQKGPGKTHSRAAWPFPAAGLNDRPLAENEKGLDQIALFAADAAAIQTAQGTVGSTMIGNRAVMLSPDSSLASAGISPPLARLTSEDLVSGGKAGELKDVQSRVIEKSFAPGLKSYLEQPLVPNVEGIDPAIAGMPKLNLNKLLAQGAAGGEEMSEFIRKAMPEFVNRKGGFPDDYLKTLAANVIDYADMDKESTASANYRGLDAYPLVSEFLFKSRWENVRTVGGRKFLDLSVSIYVELWNMTNIPTSGSFEITYETKYGFQIPPNPNLIRLNDLSNATHNLIAKDGYHWFPAINNVVLQPNEYRVYKCGTVNYSFDAVSSSEFISSPLTLSGETYGSSGAGYRMKWNGIVVDQSRGGVHRNDSSINFPADTKNSPRQRLRTTIPSHSHSRGSFINNMGDSRMSFYNLSPQDANVYPQNFSPNRRNIRTGTIYSASSPNQVYGRVLPSEWPDGGHDSPFGVDSVASLVGMAQGTFADDHRIEPDNPGFFGSLPSLALGEMEAPTRLSNLGRFLSVTELGRIYDPVMWRVRTQTLNPAGQTWGDVVDGSISSGDYGGGNTLRIGRPEHPGFDKSGMRATRLLDLFHVGMSRSEDKAEREGPLIKVEGNVNLNTASKDAIRMLIAGELMQDPEMRSFVNDSHEADIRKFPTIKKVSPLPDVSRIADRIATAVIRTRPFGSNSEVAHATESNGTKVFGNPKLFPGFESGTYPMLQWTDSAAEETFARVFEASTVRSRNFRVWVVGQALTPTDELNPTPEILAEVRQAFNVFADPGERRSDGTIDPTKSKLTILHENDF